jgi:hypothetical protein
MHFIWRILWRTPVVIGALMIAFLAAAQVGWSGAEIIVNIPYWGGEYFVRDLLFMVGLAVSFGCFALVRRIAKPLLWVMVPITFYAAIVMGAWGGYASDFDGIRGEAIKHHAANAYALEHMSARGRYFSCQDNRIELSDDAKSVCTQVLNGKPGEIIPGSEHKCGLLGLFTCINSAPRDKEPSHR